MIRTLVAAALFTALPSAALAQDASEAIEGASYNRASQVQYVLLGTMPAAEVFAPSFLAAVPESQLKAIVDKLVAQNGKLLSVDELHYTGDGTIEFDLVFEQARAAAILQLSDEAPYQALGFRITDVRKIDDAPQKILQDFIALPGNNGFGVYILGDSGPQPILSNRPTEQFAIGSAFKLWVLSALVQEIKAGRRHWNDVVPLEVHSVPSGQLQDWPIGSPVTLHTLATMMISISDNTATDELIHVLGRDRIAAEMAASGHAEPSRNIPMLTTVEFFALKSGDPARIAAFTAADDAGQAELIRQWAPTLTAQNINPAKLIGPTAIDTIEWFASPNDIADILARLRDSGDQTALDILSINTLLSADDEAQWAYAGYKGGSEVGVGNFSWLVQDKQGRWFVVSASWNDKAAAIDNEKLVALGKRMLAMLHQ